MYPCILDDYDMVMTGLWGEYDTYHVTTTWQWHYHKMTMTLPWHYIHVLLVSWSWYGHRLIMSLSVLGRARIVSWSCHHHDMVVHWFVGANIVINGHLRSFISISLSCLHYLKAVRRPLFKVITWSLLIIPRQRQVRDVVKACSWKLFHDQVMFML